MILSLALALLAATPEEDEAWANAEAAGRAVDEAARELADEASVAAQADSVEMTADEAMADANTPMEDRSLTYIGDWTVLEQEHSCSIIPRYPMFVEYDARLERVTFGFTEKSVKTLRDGQQVPVIFTLGHAEDYRTYPAKMMSVTVGSTGNTSFKTTFEPWFLDHFAKQSGIGFLTTKMVLINAYSLDGSAAAVAALRTCAERVSNIRPSDPFTK